MANDIDRLIREPAPDETSTLFGIEDAVWNRIGAHEERTRAGRVRIALVMLALAVGVANGGLMLQSRQAEPSELRIFTVSAALSPLGSLDLRG